MLLAMSVGNSHITFGVHDDSDWIRRWRIQTVAAKTSDEYLVILRTLLDAAQIPARKVSRAILSSVVPPLTATMAEAIQELTGRVPLLLSPALDLGIRITTENPAEVGSDLVANAVAAFERFRSACIVVDFGTALSFTAVAGPPGELRGVAIAPGLTAAMESLSRSTAQLFTVPLAAPPVTVGRNSVHSIQAGIVFGYVGLVGEIIRRMRAELGGNAAVAVTGGQSPIMAPLLGEKLLHEPWLTLEGLRIVAERAA
ncbi:MAG TPA: type III pantothenate kinase [Spirochaetia bacterium]|nr:type III pantothenate kinase [Spirochaetia bacterium]